MDSSAATTPLGDTLGDSLARAASLNRPGAGVRFLDRKENATLFSWADIQQRALRAAEGLRRCGVRPGDRVVLVLPTDPLFMDLFFGCGLAGAVPVPMYPPVRLGRLDEYFSRTAAMVRACAGAVVVADKRVMRVLGTLLEHVRPPLGLVAAETLVQAEPGEAWQADPDDLAMVQFSSGTTVAPKAVGLTHRQVLANARAIHNEIFTAFPEEDGHRHCGVSWLPLYHDMGLIGCIFPALDHPSDITLIPPELFLARPAVWLRALSRFKGTISPAPDFAYALCVERVRDDEIEGLDLSAWVAALDGAEPIAPANLRRFAARFAPYGLRADALKPVYGLSEASLAVTFSPFDKPWSSVRVDSEALSMGHAVDVAEGGVELVRLGPPLRGFGVEIRGPDGASLPERSVGRLFVRGPSVMKGYLDREEQPIVDGWLDTGDVGFLVDGELVVTGRAKDLIVLRGKNHAPQDIERAVDGVAGVRTGCVIAVGDLGEDGERLLVFAEVRESVAGLADACLAAVRAACGVEPDLVVLLQPGTLARTSSGKLRRGESLRRWKDGTLTPPDAVTPLRLAGAVARSWLTRMRNR